jgi:para-aminobenzoate synthetase component I
MEKPCIFVQRTASGFRILYGSGSEIGNFKLQEPGLKNVVVIGYDLKNQFENLSSLNEDRLNFPEEFGFIPSGEFKIEAVLPPSEETLKPWLEEIPGSGEKFNVQCKVRMKDYIRNVLEIKKHIQRGDIYEMNYCIEFFAEEALVSPYKLFLKLYDRTQAPFSSFMRYGDHYIISASPERFLKREGNKLISQPIKGTAPRSTDGAKDKLLKSALQNSLKEQTENVMIVDLVRNDLSRIAVKGSVRVEELFGVYSFNTVHQMISTITAELPRQIFLQDILRASFPMGSMTGAPKVRAMELIEEFETTKRGVYSGAMGILEANGDFDLSVVIRTILYNSKSKYLSFMAGSAITASSDPEQEYAECLLKARAMIEALGADFSRFA